MEVPNAADPGAPAPAIDAPAATNVVAAVESPAPEPVAEAQPRSDWPLVGLVLFRFLFAYQLIFNLPFPVGRFAGMAGAFQTLTPVFRFDMAYMRLWDRLVVWTGTNVLGVSVDITNISFASGDRLYDWVRTFCVLVMAIAVTLIWSLVDYRRRQYRRALDFLRAYLRLVVGCSMFYYGFDKVFVSQFPHPYVGRMLQRIGDANPMALLWTTLGASTPYQMFSGTMELVGGYLVFWRRTTSLGALLVMGVMTNVVALNLCYDVPVKLYSSNILFMAAVLLAPDVKRLVNVLLLNRPTEPRVEVAADTMWGDRPRLKPVMMALQILFVGYNSWGTCAPFIGVGTPMAMKDVLRYRFSPPTGTPPFGAWERTDLAEGEPDPTGLKPFRWLLVFRSMGQSLISLMSSDGKERVSEIIDDGPDHTLIVLGGATEDGNGEVAERGSLAYDLSKPGEMGLTGTLAGHPFNARFRRLEVKDFNLVKRGFHWVNEYPHLE